MIILLFKVNDYINVSKSMIVLMFQSQWLYLKVYQINQKM